MRYGEETPMRNGHKDSYANVGNPRNDYVEGTASIWIDLDAEGEEAALEQRYTLECWRLRDSADDSARPVLHVERLDSPMLTALVDVDHADAAEVDDLYSHAARLSGFDGDVADGAACKEFLQKKGLLADSEFVDDAIWERRALIPTPEGERTEEGRPQKARRGFFGRLFGRR